MADKKTNMAAYLSRGLASEEEVGQAIPGQEDKHDEDGDIASLHGRQQRHLD